VSRLRRLGLWSATVAVGVVGALLAGEIALRLWDWRKGVTPPYTHNVPETIARPNGYFNFDLEPGLDITYNSASPTRLHVNRWGFRGPEYDPVKPRGTVRVFCLGGSSTFDPFLSDEATWPARLGVRLQERLGRPVESINGGRYGYTTAEILGLFMQRVLRHQPDVIVVYSTFNDARATVSPYWGRDDGPQLYGQPLLAALNRSSALFAFFDFHLRYAWPGHDLYDRLIPADLHRRTPPPEHRAFVADPARRDAYLCEWYRRNVRAIVRVAADNGVRVLLATQLVEKRRVTPLDGALANTLREVARGDEIPLHDFAADVADPGGAGLMSSYVHLNERGARFVGDGVADSLTAMLAGGH
jgi:lysophospholipase L1-like esterase